MAGAVLRGDPDEFRVSDGVTWGLGAQFPSRSPLRALVEWQGEFVIKDNTAGHQPAVRRRGRQHRAALQPDLRSDRTSRSARCGRPANGLFVHGGSTTASAPASRTVGGLDIDHNAWGFDVRLGWHPGVTPPRQRVRVIKETTTVTNTVTPPPPAPAAPPPNRNPTFSVTATCNPCVVEPAQTRNLDATATDPDGDPLTYRWTRAAGHVQHADGAEHDLDGAEPGGQRAGHRDGAGHRAAARRPAASTCRWCGAQTLDVRGRALRLRSLQPAAGCAEDPRRRGDEAAGEPGRAASRSKGTATASAPPSTTSRSASGAPTRSATTSSAAASRTRGCGPSATARSGRLPTTTRPQGRAMNRRAHLVVIIETVSSQATVRRVGLSRRSTTHERVPARSSRHPSCFLTLMRFLKLYLVGYFILLLGAGLALWQSGSSSEIPASGSAIGASSPSASASCWRSRRAAPAVTTRE